DDYLIIWKLNNKIDEIFPLSNPDNSLKPKISSLLREGKLTRLYDGIIETKKKINELSKLPKFSNYHPYLLVFSDGDDIGSIAKSKDILTSDNNIPFFFFSYINKNNNELMIPYKDLADITNGKLLERPEESDIKKMFIDRLNRYEIKFQFNKNEVIKKKKYFVKITAGSKYLEFDLRKLFGNNGKDVDTKNIEIKTNENRDNVNNNNNSEKKNNNNNLINSTNLDNSNDKNNNTTNTTQKNGENSSDNFSNNKNQNNDQTKDTNTTKTTIKKLDWLKFDYKILFLLLLLIIIVIIILILKKLLPLFADHKDNDSNSGKNRSFDIGKESDNSFIEKSNSDIVEREKEALKEILENNLDKVKDKSKENKKTEVTTSQPSKIDEEHTDKKEEDSKNIQDIKDPESDKEEKENQTISDINGVAGESIIKNIVFVREKEDLNEIRKYNKISVFHNEKTNFIDEAEHYGEEINLNSNLKVKVVSKDNIICVSRYPMLLDEVIETSNIKLISSKISFNDKKSEFKITFLPENKVDLTKIFKEKQEINANKKSRIFGNRDAIIEKSLNSKSIFERDKKTGWTSAQLIQKKEMEYMLVTEFQLCIDTVIEVKENEEVKDYFVYKITSMEDGKYKNKLKLFQ
ncbi:MAG TPA: hypothetical protein PK771_10015, partial [Spirochaetota bacterium]|nr:hypothetical protein [Spirochaetota bacterium]